MIFVYILAGIVGLIIILAIIAPKESTLERSITVNAGPEAVYNDLKSLKNFDIWAPWGEMDPDRERKYTGTDGELGSVAWWSGNKKVGEGEQEIIKLEPHSYIETELRFIKPFKATNKAWFKIEPEGEGSKVTWGFHATFKLPMSIFMIFMNMEKTLTKQFDSGLAKFKARIEAL